MNKLSMLAAAVGGISMYTDGVYRESVPKRNYPRMVVSSPREIAEWNRAVAAKKQEKVKQAFLAKQVRDQQVGDAYREPAVVVLPELLPELTLPPLSPSNLEIGGKYNWKSQPERLVYLGPSRDATGLWFQFAKVDDEKQRVWCEVRASDLVSFERTKDI